MHAANPPASNAVAKLKTIGELNLNIENITGMRTTLRRQRSEQAKYNVPSRNNGQQGRRDSSNNGKEIGIPGTRKSNSKQSQGCTETDAGHQPGQEHAQTHSNRSRVRGQNREKDHGRFRFYWDEERFQKGVGQERGNTGKHESRIQALSASIG
jgi:hypothetical protein